MTWTYSQSTGELRGVAGTLVATGYSGCGLGKDNPDLQAEKCIGPIPRGKWALVAVFDSPSHGPYCIRLAPAPGTETFGRDGFLIHGDSVKFPGEASKGCIILPRRIREYVWRSEDDALEVIV